MLVCLGARPSSRGTTAGALLGERQMEDTGLVFENQQVQCKSCREHVGDEAISLTDMAHLTEREVGENARVSILKALATW